MPSARKDPRRSIVSELKRVDDSFAMLKAGRDLDDRLADVLDGNVDLPSTSRKPLYAGLAVATLAIVGVLALVANQRSTAENIANAPAPDVKDVKNVVAPVPNVPDVERTDAPRQEQLALVEDVKFIEVPLGMLEVRAPSVVDVKDGRAVVVSGTARFLERGKAPRTLIEGQSIAWRVQPVPDKSESKVGASTSTVTDADVDAALAKSRSLQARGAFGEAADVLSDLLAKHPPARVLDTVGYERAALLVKARDFSAACKALDDHKKRFPKSENAADVDAQRSRAGCR